MNVIDNDIAKEKLVIKISYKDFISSKEEYYSKMRIGFRFALIIDEAFEGREEDFKILEAFKYIIISSKSIYYERISSDNVVVTLK